MEKLKVGGIVLALALAILGVFQSDKVETIIKEVPFGAQVSNENNEAQFYYGGISGRAVNFVSTTTNACSVQNPTGKYVYFQSAFTANVSTTTTTVLALATSTHANRFATSTAIQSYTIAANTTGTSTYMGNSNQNMLAPGEWVHYGYGAGTTLPTVAQQQTGTCNVLFFTIKP